MDLTCNISKSTFFLDKTLPDRSTSTSSVYTLFNYDIASV